MTIFITGVTGGIGFEITKNLLKKGHHVIGCATSKNNLLNVKNELNSRNLAILSLDVRDIERTKKIFKKIIHLDVLINTAGTIKPVEEFKKVSMDEWKKTIEVNLLGTANTCHFALPLLLRASKGKIINFAGGGSAYGRAYHTAYAASKTAVVRFTESLALEYPTLNINVIAPGAHKTKMWNDEKKEKKPKKWGNMNNLLRFIDFLISDKSSNITGKFLHYKDDWNNLKILRKNKELFTLRRIEKIF